MPSPRVLILLANGTNRDQDAAQAFVEAGADPVILPLNQLRSQQQSWREFHILVLPGGFSYGDALGAGKLLALDLQTYFAEEVAHFVESGKPVIGICNGFQALVKAGILPGDREIGRLPQATLTHNARGSFECRWVTLIPSSQKCVWTRGLSEPVECPVAHGEGRFVLSDPEQGRLAQEHDQVALVYAAPTGLPANGEYPYNPNGSSLDIAGVCNPQGNVLGLMPHPENHIFPYQHPLWTRGARRGSGLPLFANGVAHAREL